MRRGSWCLLTFWALVLAAYARPPAPPLEGPDLSAVGQPDRPPPMPPSTDDEADEEMHQKGQAPKIVLEKIGPKTLVAGKPLVTELVVRNQGNVPAYNVEIEDEIPANAKLLRAEPQPVIDGKRLMWSVETLRHGQEKRFRVEVQVGEEQQVKSQAKATFSTVAGHKARILRPQLTLRKVGPERAGLGDTVPFTLEVSNDGTAPATNVVIRDLLPEGLEHARGREIEADVGTLAPGERRTIKLNLKASRSGRHVNEAVATADGNLTVRALAPIVVGRPDLQLVKTGPGERYLNTAAVFYLQVTNAGDAPAKKVQLIDAMPVEFKFIEATDNGRFDPQTNTVQWDFATLEAGESRRVAIRTRIGGSGEFRNQAVARAEPNYEAKAEANVQVIGIPALLLEVVDRSDPIEAGAETIYDIRVVNQGSAANTNVQLLALMPPGLRPVKVQDDVPHRIQGQQIIFEPIPELSPKAERTLQVTVRGETPGDHRFKVQLQSDQMRIPVSEEESTHVYVDQ